MGVVQEDANSSAVQSWWMLTTFFFLLFNVISICCVVKRPQEVLQLAIVSATLSQRRASRRSGHYQGMYVCMHGYLWRVQVLTEFWSFLKTGLTRLLVTTRFTEASSDILLYSSLLLLWEVLCWDSAAFVCYFGLIITATRATASDDFYIRYANLLDGRGGEGGETAKWRPKQIMLDTFTK